MDFAVSLEEDVKRILLVFVAVILTAAAVFAEVSYNSLDITAAEIHFTQSWPIELSTTDTLQQNLNYAQSSGDPNIITITASSLQHGNQHFIADALSAEDPGDKVGIPAYSFTRDTGTLNIKFGENYNAGRILSNINIFIKPINDNHRFYDFDLSYSDTANPDAFTKILTITEQNPDNIPITPEWTGTVITISFNSRVKKLHTLRFDLRLSQEVQDPQTFPYHLCTNIREIDIEMTDCLETLSADFNNDCLVDFQDFATFASQWMICTDPTGTCY